VKQIVIVAAEGRSWPPPFAMLPMAVSDCVKEAGFVNFSNLRHADGSPTNVFGSILFRLAGSRIGRSLVSQAIHQRAPRGLDLADGVF
jgi:hypothetical protein